MYLTPHKERLSKLDITNFPIGQTVLFCPDCDWQAKLPGMAIASSECPECRTRLNLSRVDQELIDLIKSDKKAKRQLQENRDNWERQRTLTKIALSSKLIQA